MSSEPQVRNRQMRRQPDVASCNPEIAGRDVSGALAEGRTADPVVQDDWPDIVPVVAGELDVIETYLGTMLDEFLGSARLAQNKPESQQE